MKTTDLAIHYVCTHDQAEEIIAGHHAFWVSNCGCRENHGGCARPRLDVCLIFTLSDPGSGTGKRPITRLEVTGILQEARDKQLVARPYRDESRTATDGICFCCDDCCGYFLDPTERCDKGKLIAETSFEICSHCGICVEACYFNARKMLEDKLVVEDDQCYGCGLCLPTCPEGCIEMVTRMG